MKDSHGRTIAKTGSWRVFATFTTVLIVFIVTGKLILAVGVSIADGVLKTLTYYIHERFWEKIKWGRK